MSNTNGDKVRLRLTATAVLEYDAYFKDYDAGSPEDIIRSDKETADDDLYLFLDQEDVKWTINIEQLPEGDDQ